MFSDATTDLFVLPPVREKGTELLGSLPEVGVADQYLHDKPRLTSVI